jgi:hypothetical protein
VDGHLLKLFEKYLMNRQAKRWERALVRPANSSELVSPTSNFHSSFRGLVQTMSTSSSVF